MLSNDDFNKSSKHDSEEEVLDNFFDKIRVKKTKIRRVHLNHYENNSGTGGYAPNSIASKFNWGAFLFNWIWGIKYKKWQLLLCLPLLFIPLGFIFSLVLAVWAGFNGNNWAWGEVQYKDENDFNFAQKLWVKWWFAIVSIILILALGILIFITQKDNTAQEDNQKYSLFISKELSIPDYVYENSSIEDELSSLLLSGKYIIYWQYQDNDAMKNKKEFVEKSMEKQDNYVKERFLLYPDLKSENEIDKSNNYPNNDNSDANEAVMNFTSWLNQRCSTGYCIINPQVKKYYKVRGSNKVILKAIQILNSWK